MNLEELETYIKEANHPHAAHTHTNSEYDDYYTEKEKKEFGPAGYF